LSSGSASGGRHGGTVALAVVFAIVAVLAAIAGVIYLTKTAQSLPSILGAEPHHKGHRTLRGVGALVVAVALIVIAGISLARSGKSKSAANA
jgi:ribose/xylose/arabinose/galactoside ABC-type transport system permease subunit